MSKEVKVVYKSIPLPILLSLIFMTLKLCNVITWSWWWVFAPIWIPSALGVLILFCFCILGIIVVLNEPY